MKLVVQPKDSSICGQCCVAMISGKKLEDVIKLFGHSHATRTKELSKALKSLGFECEDRLTKLNNTNGFPELCIVKVTYDWRKNSGHWMVYEHGMCYCPSGFSAPSDCWVGKSEMGRITSFLKITNLK